MSEGRTQSKTTLERITNPEKVDGQSRCYQASDQKMEIYAEYQVRSKRLQRGHPHRRRTAPCCSDWLNDAKLEQRLIAATRV